MPEDKTVGFSGWSIASALMNVLASDRRSSRFLGDFSKDVDLNRIFAVPSSDPPDPNEILPVALINWPTKNIQAS